MLTQIEYTEPTFSRNYDWNNPLRIRDALSAVIRSVAESVSEISEHINNPNYILVNGEPIEKTVGKGAWRRGEVRFFHRTWAEAQKICNEAGAVFCDGRNGSPQFHPDPDDSTSVARYIKASDSDTDSGDTGGAATHTHTFTEGSVSGDTGNTDLTHNHDATASTSSTTHDHGSCCFTTQAPSATTNVKSGTDATVASCDHTHDVDVDLPDGGAHSHAASASVSDWQDNGGDGHLHSVDLDVSGSSVGAGSHDPPHVTLIALMKV
jgi:hypothetical protein